MVFVLHLLLIWDFMFNLMVHLFGLGKGVADLTLCAAACHSWCVSMPVCFGPCEGTKALTLILAMKI